MPGFDRSGPQGMGAMTGRGQGRCGTAGGEGIGRGGAGFGRGYAGTGCRRMGSMGRGRGLGAGRGAGFAPLDERQSLQEQAEQLKQALMNVEQRLAETEK